MPMPTDRPLRPDEVIQLPVLPSEFTVYETPDVGDEMQDIFDLAQLSGVPIETTAKDMAETRRSGGGFAIHDPGLAEWALRRMAESAIRLDEIRKLYEQFVANIDRWYEQTSMEHRASIAFFTEHLEAFGREHREAHPKEATIGLPSGAVKTTSYEPAAKMADAEAVLAWAKAEHPEIVNKETKTREWVTAPDVKKLVRPIVETDEDGTITATKVVDKESGQVVPGMIVEPGHVTAKVTLELP